MHRLVEAALALALVFAFGGCSFHAPDASSPGGADDSGGDAGATADAASDAPPGARCATYDYSYNNHKYRLVKSGQPWAQAKANCEADGGYLVKLDTTAEDTQVVIVVLADPVEVWTGLRDVNQTGVYVWTDGTAPTFTRWNGTAPGADSPDCVVKNTSPLDARWYPRDCTDSRGFICECNP